MNSVALRACALVALLSSGCARSLGSFPAVPVSPATDFKMIVPAATAEACRTRWIGAADPEDGGLLAAAVAQLKQRDAEVENLYDVRVATSGWSIGLVSRECVRVTADLGRPVQTVTLPRGHEHHHH